LEWKVLYVGSAHDSHQDQVLDEILVGPVPVGLNKFVLQADPPDPARLPPDEVLGVTVVLVTCSYCDKEFVRVGFYVNNEYLHPDYMPTLAVPTTDGAQGTEGNSTGYSTASLSAAEATNGAIPDKPLPVYPNLDMSLVQRHILADKPRITKFSISWGKETEASASQSTATAASVGISNSNYEATMATPSSKATSASPPMSPLDTSMDVLMEG
jgi:histone chaperone ASF1